MTVDPAVIPGLLLLAAELIALAAVGYVVARTVLRQSDERLALAQGLVIGPALWGFVVNVVLYALPAPAGVVAAWVLTLALAAGLAWRAGESVRPGLRTTAAVVVAALALFWVALASRQLLTIVEDFLHLGLAASIQAGGYHPPAFPWSPDLPTAYHYGSNLLIGLLAPPFGPDLALVTEVLGAYLWMSFALVVGTLVFSRGSWIAVVVAAPLVLTAGAWTQVHYAPPPGIVQLPGPGELPALNASVRTWLAEVYWPTLDAPWETVLEASPPNIWKPSFTLAYALTLVVLERVTAGSRRSWPSTLVLAALVGFLGLADEAVAVMVVALWILLEVAQLVAARPARARRLREALRAAAGPLLAALVLAVGGGAITGLLTGPSGSGLALAWMDDPGSRRPIGDFIDISGGLGVLGLGVVVIVAVAVLLARRDRLVLALALGSGLFLLAALTLHYEFSRDVVRLDGHARNFALMALLGALSVSLPALRLRWRYAAATLVFVLVTWPTIVTPLRSIGVGLGNGIQLANAESGRREHASDFLGRYVARSGMSDRVAAYIRDRTAADARILAPDPIAMSIATGRANASGFTDFIGFSRVRGPEYVDAIRRLEPSAIRRLGFDYVQATDDWLAYLPPRAAGWIENPNYFEPLLRDGASALFRIRPEFLAIESPPDPASFEALRQAVPPSATVYLSPSIGYLGWVRAASVLSHAQLLGEVRVFGEHLRPGFDTQPLGGRTPDLVVTSARLAPSAFPPGRRTPIWSNDDFAVYAPGGTVPPIMPAAETLLSVRMSSVSIDDGRLAFTATLADDAARRWTGQDWVILAADDSPWALPRDLGTDGRSYLAAQWFVGQFHPGQGVISKRYVFDARAASLSLEVEEGRFVPLETSDSGLGPGVWTLALRLRHNWTEAALIPVVRLTIAEDGAATFAVFEDALGVTPIP
ncbi:MAG: hypothetical protein OXG33_08360 [Chloroflexi bacterium]|nr:hypothetical protein [Chloroflexota bacterium]